MSISKNIDKLTNLIPKETTLIAVSKTKPVSAILEAYNVGQRIFGENKIQEMVSKHNELPKDIHWHMIGHLQRNKIKYMASFVDLIHGVDNFKTLIEINKQAKKHNRVINCLLQAKIAQENTKFGLPLGKIEHILNSKELIELENVNIKGLMGMASFTSNKKQVKEEFKTLSVFFNKVKKTHNLEILSIGMSGDYSLAIKAGSNMVRIGSAIFGDRSYS